MIEEIEWKHGTPPHPGWYYTSQKEVRKGERSYLRSWRWWSGTYWSQVARPGWSLHEVGIAAITRMKNKRPTEWSWQWPTGEHPAKPHKAPQATKWNDGTPRSTNNAFTAHERD